MIKGTKAITLVELLAIILVVGIAIPPLVLMWQDVSFRSYGSEAISQSSFYSQGLMEEIKSKSFDEDDALPRLNPKRRGRGRDKDKDKKGGKGGGSQDITDSSNFGPDKAESDSSYFDDVDDFDGYIDYCNNQGVCDNDSSRAFQRSVSVDYVFLDLTTNTWQSCGLVNCDQATDCSTCSQCCYKRIAVSVDHRLADYRGAALVSR